MFRKDRIGRRGGDYCTAFECIILLTVQVYESNYVQMPNKLGLFDYFILF